MARVHGYHAALSQAKIATDPTLVRDGEFTFDAGLRAGMDLLTQANRPTAVFASNDLQALGLIEAARCCNLRIPDDLSVVGFDDMAPARWASPPLTTVQQPFAEMGRTAVQNLMQLIAGEKLATPRVELATHIVVRQSTAPASARLGVA
jgi:LacI family transcriptional regulator